MSKALGESCSPTWVLITYWATSTPIRIAWPAVPQVSKIAPAVAIRGEPTAPRKYHTTTVANINGTDNISALIASPTSSG